MKRLWLAVLLAFCVLTAHARAQDILFVTQPPFGSDFTTVNSTFGNHRAHTGAAPRGGDLYLRYADGTLRNLTAEAGYGLQPLQEIAVREPSVHWSGTKALFSMVVGGTKRNDYAPVYWQIYEVNGLARGATAVITRLPQPSTYNNVSPIYGTDDRILFTSDRPRNGNRDLYPQLDEYESAPTNTGLWSMNADGSDLRLLDHAVSGVFSPSIASDGRVVMTRWDHLQRDQQNYAGATYGAFNYVSEESTATTGDAAEIFPEPRIRPAGSNIHGHRINIFLPWQIFEDGTGHETLNHVGRHELSHYFDSSRDGLPEFSSPANRRTAERLFQLAEDPTRPRYFFATYAPEFQTHAAGQIVALDGDESVNAADMQIDFVTDPVSESPLPEGSTTPAGHPGLFRDPLPLANGTLIAVRSTEARADRRTTGSLSSRYDFHLVALQAGSPYFTPGERLIPGGIVKSISYFDNYEYRQHEYSGALWELDPVEVRARPRPAARTNPLPAIETALLEQELGAAGTAALRRFLTDNDLALLVSRNVTRRADRQQDFNLKVFGSSTQTAVPGSTPAEVAFLQFFQGDLLRGYASFNSGRRPIAAPMHDGLLPELAGAPEASVRIAADGSIAAFVPASRALTWQLTDAAGGAIVRERYWVSFARGEIRVCANCHGLNRTDVVLGQGPPTNTPEALRELLDWWSDTYAPEPAPVHALSGTIHYDGSGAAVAGVALRAAGAGGDRDAQTNAGGEFSFTDLTAGNWTLTPTKSGPSPGAVTAYDAAMVLRATLGLQSLSGLAPLACDATGNGSLSPLDATRILQLSLGAIERLPAAELCGSDWIFAPVAAAASGQTPITPELSQASCRHGALAFASLAADQSQRDFAGRLFGDCSGNWSAPAAALGGAGQAGGRGGRIHLGRARPRGRAVSEIAVWVRSAAPLHSLHLSIASRDGAVSFIPAPLPEGVLMQQRRDAGGVTMALASGRGLPVRATRLGTLVVRGNGRASRRGVRLEATADDIPIRVPRRR